MGDRTKLYIAVTFLVIAIIAWIGSFAFAITYYYKIKDFEATSLKPLSEQNVAVLKNCLEQEDKLTALKDINNAPSYLELSAEHGELLPALDAKITELKNALENEKRDIQTYQDEANEKLRPFGDALAQLEETKADFTAKVAEARTELLALRENKQVEIESEKERIEGFDREIREFTTKIAEMEEEQRVKRNDLMLECEKYRKLYETLVARSVKAQYGSDNIDGRVLYANIQENFVIVDLGKRDRVRKGMTFEVLGLLKGVLPIKKGMIEIREVYPEVAYATILSTPNKENPIQVNDGIMNKLFDREEKLVFVCVGNLKSFNRGEFISFVEGMGDVVSQQVGTDTDYLIVGTGVEANSEEAKQVELARELGVKIITENFFLKLVRFE